MSFPLDHDSLITFLKRLDFEPTLQSETGQIYITLLIKEVEVPLFFGLNTDSGLLQLLAYLPYRLYEEAVGEVARLLHILNKQLDMPGFGMDEKEKLLFYRYAIPCLENQVDEKQLRLYIGALRLACDTFMYAISSIASGTRKVDEFFHDS